MPGPFSGLLPYASVWEVLFAHLYAIRNQIARVLWDPRNLNFDFPAIMEWYYLLLCCFILYYIIYYPVFYYMLFWYPLFYVLSCFVTLPYYIILYYIMLYAPLVYFLAALKTVDL